jgi:hypothetical protein
MLARKFGEGESLTGRGTRLIDKAEVGLDESIDAPNPAPAVGVLGPVAPRTPSIRSGSPAPQREPRAGTDPADSTAIVRTREELTTDLVGLT